MPAVVDADVTKNDGSLAKTKLKRDHHDHNPVQSKQKH
jgi:hypothetical protein